MNTMSEVIKVYCHDGVISLKYVLIYDVFGLLYFRDTDRNERERQFIYDAIDSGLVKVDGSVVTDGNRLLYSDTTYKITFIDAVYDVLIL